ncbi:aminomuconate-semialdehyde/2-hydroxymuconate-6-semialdehyde dehydrogenase [Sphingomonas laterariae]|uniref:Aminomuconate-semialdehyde/2-hydroxymuconate-6-semialdehyde dehydrogenase n=1 Tax=Edaphosphingomonas laterariae TaxID=861865 RepID=A0A239CW03_9SPHN|nr:2-hydroxymuconic semialdehyde dehydrogenase [Sphingomonas laterariae]SNS24405.1 aminomuconate-semialdehyde/2-hydroxymuconate-6-semialdehyde dehydrogenase [Sphingomonas laterariae]
MPHTPYPFADRTLPNYVDGAFVAAGDTFPLIDPVTGRKIAGVAAADRALVDAAVAAARRALTGPWGRMALADRVALLGRIADAIEARFDDFVAAEIADTGKSLLQATRVDIPRGAANFRAFAALAQARSTQCFESDTPDGLGAINYSIAKPLGVVAVVSPWNLPLLLLTWKVAPALSCGNTIVAKPSEETPSTATLLAEVMHEVGVPEGVFNLIHGFGAGSAGEWLVSHADVDAITFTGESATGTAIMRAAAEGVKPISFELGGKNAAIIFEDADFEAAIAGTMRSVFSNCGQVCLCSERVYVARPIFDRFVAELATRARALKLGDPYAGADMGPLISAAHREKVLGYYRLAVEEGATIVTGGGVPDLVGDLAGGSFVEPTILTGLADDARCVREEIFGPVCHIAPFDSEEEVIARANDTRYGLAAALWTSDVKRAHRVARQMDVGIVWVNEWFLRDLRTPFGGTKLSGIGREGGEHSLAFYSEPMNICIKL